jgi:hypothetical protein
LRRDQNQIVGLGEELETEDGLDGGAIDARGPGSIEVAHRGEAPDPAARQAALETAPGAFLLFGLGEMLEELGGTPPALGGLREEIVEVGGSVAEAEGRERLSERAHWGPPVQAVG